MKYLGAPQSGSQANTTASKGRAGQYYRNRRSPVQPVGTGRRAFVRSAFGASSSAYATLTGSQQAAWAAYAATTPYTDSLGQSIILTGHQMFVAINTQMQNVGQAIEVLPPASSTVFSQGLVNVSAMADGTLLVTLAGAGSNVDFSLVAFSAPQSGGTSFCKVFWQADFLGGDSVNPEDYSSEYVSQFGIPPQNSRIFYSIRPVNEFGVAGVSIQSYAVVVPVVAGAVVTVGIAGVINWTIAGAAPFNWIVYTSNDAGVTWNFEVTIDGAYLTATSLPSGVLARVVGVDVSNNILNGASNAVTVV